MAVSNFEGSSIKYTTFHMGSGTTIQGPKDCIHQVAQEAMKAMSSYSGAPDGPSHSGGAGDIPYITEG